MPLCLFHAWLSLTALTIKFQVYGSLRVASLLTKVMQYLSSYHIIDKAPIYQGKLWSDGESLPAVHSKPEIADANSAQ